MGIEEEERRIPQSLLSCTTMWSRVAIVVLSVASCHAGLLGAGTGEGSCAAAPFRAPVGALKWPLGCPAGAECCSEYGYCRSQDEWLAGNFRDCNGKSNGRPLAPEAITAENIAAANGDASAAGLINVPAGATGVPPSTGVSPTVPVNTAAGVGYAAAPIAGAGYAAAPIAGAGYSAAPIAAV